MSTPRTKEEIRAAAEALFKDLDTEFGKKEKKVKAAPVAPIKKEPPVSEGVEANRIAELMSSRSPWKSVSVVSHLVTQVCKTCQGETEFLGNTLIRHQHKKFGYTWDHILPEAPEHTSLPHTIENHRIQVEQCPTCIRLNFYQMDTDSTVQLSLFH